MSDKKTLFTFMKNKQMTILIVIFSIVQVVIICSLLIFNIRIKYLEEENKKLKEVEESLNIDNYALKNDIPTKISQLENDNGFVNENDVTNIVNNKIEKSDAEINKQINIKYADLLNRIEFFKNSSSSSTSSSTSSGITYESIKDRIRDDFYPVGSLYYSMDKNYDPNISWGGTWEKLDEGYFVEATQDETKIETTIQAGLPNIIGLLDPQWRDSTAGSTIFGGENYAKGAFSLSFKNNVTYAAGKAKGNYLTTVNFNASKGETKADGTTYKSDSDYHVYGKSDTVQPNAYYAYIWRRIN